MNATNAFFVWFFTGLNGLGGWFIFMLLAGAAVVWLLYDSSRRHLPALGWKTGIILLATLILPSIIFRFSGAETQVSLDPFVEAIFYLGLLGGILPVVLAVGYLVTFQGMKGCLQGHVYESRLGKCPECARNQVQMQPQPVPQPVFPAPRPEPAQNPINVPPPTPQKPKTHAWLVSQDGRNYQLNCGDTTIGRLSTNDIQLQGDTTVSRQHAKIVEQNGHFKLYDLGTTSGTRLNNKRVTQPMLLEPDDEIRLGDNTVFRFVTSHR